MLSVSSEHSFKVLTLTSYGNSFGNSWQILCTVIITNNHAPFHLWCRKSLIKCQKVSKYYDRDCKA